jgi:elongation factor Ts
MQFYEDSCLLDQKYVLDETRKIGQVVADTGRAIGADLHIQEFVRFQCGEGLEKEQSNFAEDVSQALQQTA